jgi:GT2 family glycosyltransferase
MLTVILPTKDNITPLHEAISSFFSSTIDRDFKFVVAYNFENKQITEVLESFPFKIDRVHYTGENNIGCYNRIMRENPGDFLLIHDDMSFKQLFMFDWLQSMKSNSKNETIGLMTMIGGVGTSGDDYVNGLKYVGSWFMYIPEHTVKEVGYFDDTMRIGEDIDYAYRVNKTGKKIIIMPFWHEHHQTRETPHLPQTEEIKKEAALYFKKKHGFS